MHYVGKSTWDTTFGSEAGPLLLQEQPSAGRRFHCLAFRVVPHGQLPFPPPRLPQLPPPPFRSPDGPLFLRTKDDVL